MGAQIQYCAMAERSHVLSSDAIKPVFGRLRKKEFWETPKKANDEHPFKRAVSQALCYNLNIETRVRKAFLLFLIDDIDEDDVE